MCNKDLQIKFATLSVKGIRNVKCEICCTSMLLVFKYKKKQHLNLTAMKIRNNVVDSSHIMALTSSSFLL